MSPSQPFAVVTGVSSGIGAATARRPAAEGFSHVNIDRLVVRPLARAAQHKVHRVV
jgi:NAD(P)-dependent dehydrogenase (short-subunit alcohol dehydrogenase family)